MTNTYKPFMLLAFLAITTNTPASIVNGNITSGGGAWTFINNPAGLTVGNDTYQDSNLYGFNETQNVIINQDITGYTQWNWLNNSSTDISVAIATGTEVASHYIFFDPAGFETIEGWVDFDAEVLAIIVDTNTLSLTDSLMNTSVTYLNPGLRGLENWQDWVRVDPANANRIDLRLRASSPGDYIRVLTRHSIIAAAAVPEPSIILMMGFGLLGLGLIRRQTRN